MAPSSSKRVRNDEVHTPKSKKRRMNTAVSSSRPSKGALNDEEVNADALDWREVALPDRLEDAEGFFGLEEIEGVEVLRSKDSDQAPRFKVTTKTGSPRGALKRSAILQKRSLQDTTPVASIVDEEEWSGISDDQPPQSFSKPPNPLRDGHVRAKPVQRPPKDSSQSTRTGDSHSLSNVSFNVLNDREGEDVGMSSWSSLELSPETLSGLASLNFTQPTPIQAACIPEILAGHDVIGKASTGSGKTLAFGVPILERYLEDSRTDTSRNSGESNSPVALVISPTRELAHQLNAHLTALNSGALDAGLKIATVTGGLSIHKQQRLLAQADVIVGTPGRLWEVISQGHGLIDRLKLISYLVVDEADRLLSEGHFKELEEILDALDRETQGNEEFSEHLSDHASPLHRRQTLVFSATFQKSLQQKLAGKTRFSNQTENPLNNQQSLEYLLQKLNFQTANPKFIDVNPTSQMATSLQEALLECGAMEKDLYLYALLLLHPPATRILIFTNSVAAVKRLVPFLQSLGQPALPLHSGMPQKARLRSVESFTSSSDSNKNSQSPSSGSILVATDVAARGLDIADIDLIVHYHVPRTADMYVHRSGRTARASRSGKSILLCAPAEVAPVQRLVAKVHTSSTSTNSGLSILRSLDVDSSLLARLKNRVSLAQKIIATSLAKSKTSSDDNFLRTAANELGVDYSSDLSDGRRRGRGKGRQKQEREDAKVGKETLQQWKAELKGLLGKRVHSGGRERNLSGEEAERLLNRSGVLADEMDLWGSTKEIT